MLKLTINGMYAILPVDMDLAIIINSVLLDSLDEDASYPFTLSLEANRHIFGEIDRPTKSNIATEYSSTIYFGAYELLVGFGYISEITSKTVEFYVKTSGKAFLGTYGSKYLDELDILGTYNASYESLKKLAKVSYFEDSPLPFVFAPVKDEMLSLDANEGQINGFDFFTGELWEKKLTDYVETGPTCPFIFLKAFFGLLFDATGYAILEDDMTTIPGFSRIYILCQNSTNRYSTTFNGSLDYKKMLPHLTLQDLFDELRIKFNIRLIFDDNRKKVMIRSASNLKINKVFSLTSFRTSEFKKLIEELEPLPENRRFFDSVIDLEVGGDSYDPTVMGEIKAYMEFNSATNITDETKTEEISCLSRTVTSGIYYGGPTIEIGPSEYGISFYFGPVPRINSLMLKDSDLIFAIYEPLVTGNEKYTIPEMSYTPPLSSWPGSNSSPTYFARNIYRYPGSTNSNQSISLLWSDKDSTSGLHSRFHENYYLVMDAANQTHEVELIPDISILSTIREKFYENAIMSGQRYLLKKMELTFDLHRFKACSCEMLPL